MPRAQTVPEQISNRETELDAEISKAIKQAGQRGVRGENLTYLIEKIRKRRALLAIKPEFTPEVVGIAKQIIAFGGAGFGFVLTFGQQITNLSTVTIMLALFYVNITVVSMIILTWFFFQARTRYPWLYLDRMGNSDQYFYYNAVPLDYQYRPFYLWRRSTKLGDDLNRYLDNLSAFAMRSISETKSEELKNEVIQYHLLVFYQGYLDQYEQQLTHIALYGFLASMISALVVPLVWPFLS